MKAFKRLDVLYSIIPPSRPPEQFNDTAGTNKAAFFNTVTVHRVERATLMFKTEEKCDEGNNLIV